jgi:hypothetical protein
MWSRTIEAVHKHDACNRDIADALVANDLDKVLEIVRIQDRLQWQIGDATCADASEKGIWPSDDEFGGLPPKVYKEIARELRDASYRTRPIDIRRLADTAFCFPLDRRPSDDVPYHVAEAAGTLEVFAWVFAALCHLKKTASKENVQLVLKIRTSIQQARAEP